MAQVTALAQHILKLEPDQDAARLCFYHYLRNLCEASEPINSDLINRFLCRALTFTHWQENKSRLFGELNAILQHFQDTTRKQLDLRGAFRLEDIQVVPVETLRTLELVIHRYLERTASPYDQFRTFQEGNERLIAVNLQGDRSVRLTVYPKVLAIREGELVPLTQDFTLFYSSDLQLHPIMIQQLEVGPHTSARFYSSNEGIRGVITRGYTFKKYDDLNGGGLHRYPVLFYPLKRLEQFFINRKSDPMYIELTSLLEKALEMTSVRQSERQSETLKFAEAALERGRLALEHIFPDDKLVRLLINNLDKTLALEAARHRSMLHEAPSKWDNEEDASSANIAVDDVDLVEINTNTPQLNPKEASTALPLRQPAARPQHGQTPHATAPRAKFNSPTQQKAKDEEWPMIRNLPV